jgi:hypothetical protein
MGQIQSRLFRFSALVLLLFAILENILIGWAGVRMYKAARQREAREALKNLRWAVLYEYQHDSDFRLVPPRPPGPSQLRSFFGVDFFADVTWVRQPAPENGVPA